MHVKKKPGIDWSNSLLLPPAPCCGEALRMSSFLMQKVKVGASQLARFSELVSSEPALWLLLFTFPRQDSGILGAEDASASSLCQAGQRSYAQAHGCNAAQGVRGTMGVTWATPNGAQMSPGPHTMKLWGCWSIRN